MSIELIKVKATVECNCGESVEVELDGRDTTIGLDDLQDDLETEAMETHGWGSGATCPACETSHAAEVAAFLKGGDR